MFISIIALLTYNTKQDHLLINQLQSDNQSLQCSLDTLQGSYDDLIKVNEEIVTENIDMTLNAFKHIEPLKEYDKQAYIISYLSIFKSSQDPPELIQDCMTLEEYDMFCRIVEAEIGNGNFEQKCNIASCIMNRYYSEVFPNTWMELFKQKNQFTTVSNGAIHKVEVSESTRLAIDYVFLIGDTTNGCTYFRSGKTRTWHDKTKTLEFVVDDGKHNLYKLKEMED